VITWSGRGHAGYDRRISIFSQQGDAVYQQADLVNILIKLDRKFTTSLNWDVYTQRLQRGCGHPAVSGGFPFRGDDAVPAASVRPTAAVIRSSPATKSETQPPPAKKRHEPFPPSAAQACAPGIAPTGFLDAGAHYGTKERHHPK